MEIGTHDPGQHIRRDYQDVHLVTIAGHGIVRPNYRPERDRPDDDRDSQAPSRLASLMRHMDRRVAEMRANRSRAAKIQIAEDMAATWADISQLMREMG